ncbi:MAG: hypothetical protein ACOCPZ_00930, partial [Natrialbaceae archaeon]
GKKLVFPRKVTVEDLEERIRERLRSDYGIGTVDLEFDAAGNVSYLAVGTRAAGIGSTLPPATNAVAVRADPGFSASTGDIVQVWDTERMVRVLTGELRGVADDVVTVAIDAGDTPKVDPQRRYRLVTLPVEDRPDREFASLLRAAEETFATATVEAGSPLHGLPVGALALTVVAIRPDDGEPVPFPDDEYRLAPGDLLSVIARPGGLRRLETAAEPLDPAVAAGDPSLPTDDAEPTEGIQTAGAGESGRDDPTGDDGLLADDESTDEDGLPAGEDPADDDPSAPEPEGGSTGGIVSGKADADSFEEIKAQFEAADDVGATGDTDSDRTAEEATDEAAGDPGSKSFDELKAEFESGDADWEDGPSEADSPPAPEDESPGGPAGEAGATDEEDGFAGGDTDSGGGFDGDETGSEGGVTDDGADGSDELVSLEEADITFEDDPADDESEDEPAGDGSDELVGLDEAEISFDDSEDDVLGGGDTDDERQGEPEQALADDIGDLEFDDSSEDIDDFDLEADEGIFPEDGTEEGETDETGDGDEDETDDSEDGGGGGGGKSFAELKEEFESGDADWEDDISDSPGGDMRLDE